jgi:hypothetical protein
MLDFSVNAESHRLLIDYLAGQTESCAFECQMRHFSVMKPPLSEGLVNDLTAYGQDIQAVRQ